MNLDIVEVGPRDGLQNDPASLTTSVKLDFIERAIQSGVRRIEVASFVHPRLVPQMADAEALVQGLKDRADVNYIGLVLNERGLDRALGTRDGGQRGVDEVGCVAVTSDAFGQANQGQSRAESLAVSKAIIRRAKQAGLRAQVTISASFGCPFEGEIAPARILDMAKDLAEVGPLEIALADTIGVAVPSQVSELFHAVAEAIPGMPLRGHFHNTRNTGIANSWAAYKAGASALDASMGGLGGCPFAPKATGNIATEDLVYMLERSGVATGIDLETLLANVEWLGERLGRETPGMVGRAGGFPKPKSSFA